MFNHDMSPSTASLVRQDAARQGKSLHELTMADMEPIYAQMNPTVPDLAGHNIKDLLSSAAPADKFEEPTAIIVETRSSPVLAKVVAQVCKRLDIPVQVYHGTDNAQIANDPQLAPYKRRGQLTFSALNCQSMTHTIYNALLTSPDYWESTIARGKVLVFQTDAYLCEGSDFDLQDFLDFDYIGSLWGRKRPEGLVVDGGNGGFSLRDWGKTMDCVTRFPSASWRGGEDTYFCFHIDVIGGRVGLPDDCAKFGTQFQFRQKSFGTHKPSSLPSRQQPFFLSYCPEAAHLIPGRFSWAKRLAGLGLGLMNLSSARGG